MRRSILIMGCFVVCFLLIVGCTAAADPKSEQDSVKPSYSIFDRSTPYEGQFEYYHLGKDLMGTVLLDKVTGCEYINLGDFLTPRLNADGVPMCKNTKK
ncbi:hypothetical protein [Paenibacillus polymyxa]|uniref:hypothetical protein n=1 Tax=Paenibacillus polymyxa TaxID=1406 RepID=UPI0021E4EECF|nr:hypothetical protein [Paenibacillus polymyxa]